MVVATKDRLAVTIAFNRYHIRCTVHVLQRDEVRDDVYNFDSISAAQDPYPTTLAYRTAL